MYHTGTEARRPGDIGIGFVKAFPNMPVRALIIGPCISRPFIGHLQSVHILIVSKYIFYNRWKTAMGMRERQRQICFPMFRACREHKKRQREAESEERFVFSYLDSLLDIRIAEEGGRSFTEDETFTNCSEFLNAGTDTTSTALQWIMVELVKHPEIQKKLIDEVESVVDTGSDTVKEEELQRMPYLKAVILEGLRRHPPGHFVLPHAVMQEIEFEGYVIPKGALINFAVAEMGWDEKMWEEAMEFKPERFLSSDGRGVDI